MDLVDKAQQVEETQRQAQIHKITASIQHGMVIEPRDCGLCDEPITMARITALPSAVNCIDCATEKDGYGII